MSDIDTLYELAYNRVHGLPITKFPQFYGEGFTEVADMIINDLRPLTQQEKDAKNAKIREELKDILNG